MKIGYLQRIFSKELPLVVVNCNNLSLNTKKVLTISVHCDIGQPLILTASDILMISDKLLVVGLTQHKIKF